MDKEQVGKYVIGPIILFFLTVGINLAISLKMFIPQSVIEWISGSSHPGWALWAISVFTASILFILFRLGVKLPLLKPWVEALDNVKSSPLLGMSVWVPTILVLASGTALIFLQPICQSPTAFVEVSSLDQEALVKYDGEAITARPGAELILKSIPSDNTVIFCSWDRTGLAVDRIAPLTSCTTQIHLSNEPSRGIITLTLTKSFCSVSSQHPFEIIVVPQEGQE